MSTLVLRVSPRKPLFLVCAAAIALSQAGLGTYSFLARGAEAEAEVAGSAAGEYGWVPLACVMSVNAFRTVGFMVVIQLLLAESFPTEIRYGDHKSLYLELQPKHQQSKGFTITEKACTRAFSWLKAPTFKTFKTLI